jgi:hypothetical protein
MLGLNTQIEMLASSYHNFKTKALDENENQRMTFKGAAQNLDPLFKLKP